MKLKMKPNVEFNNPNEKVELYNGVALFIIGEYRKEHTIKVFQSWFPIDCLIVEAKSIKNFNGWEFEIEINLFYKGKVFVTSKTGFQEIDLVGELANPINFSFSKRKIKSLRFSLFNFVHLNGSLVKNSEEKESFSRSELEFNSDEAQLTLHNYISQNDRDAFKKSHSHGYLLTTVGELNFPNLIDQKKVDFYIRRLHVFLSFINGRRSSPRFVKGFDSNNKIVTQDFSNMKVDSYKFVASWLPFNMTENLSPLWSNFLNITKDEHDFEKISLIIHWYLEALNQSGFVDGAIILLQNSYETLFNWVFNEREEIISEDGLEKLRASDKMRLLLKYIDVDYNLPEIYCLKFENEIKKNNSLKNFPYHFTEIRNLYVHYKRKKSLIKGKYPELFNYYLLNTGIFKLEILILKMLKYNGKITARVIDNFKYGSNQIDI